MINGICLRDAIISGANNILKNRTLVDELNIFPVPDGDTGTNMSMTISAAVEELKKSNVPEDIGKVAKIVASAILRGARGNSGVILSLLFRGLSRGLENLEAASGTDMVNALGIGVDASYKAVMKPTEGTMLTVARVAFERGKVAAHFNNDPVYVWSEICLGAEEALQTTPELLPVLKKAGVVDAGGKGLCLIFNGMLSVFRDGKIIENETLDIKIESDDVFKSAAAQFDGDIRFTYCTEFIIEIDKEIKENPFKLRKYLEGIGDCVVVVDDEEIIKVHVHTENPGLALQEGVKFGQFLTVKIENMKEQHRRAVEESINKLSKQKKDLQPVEPTEEIGFISVAAGDGVHSIFEDLGCAKIISGGQTMNPSTNEILEAILATPAKTVYVLPNNKNIIMAAEQTISLAKDRQVIVVPTKTVPQGIASILAYSSDCTIEENFNLMKEAAQKISTGSITFAARDSEFGGIKIKQGDILALNNGKLVFAEKDPVKAVVKLTKGMAKKGTEFVTLIYGDTIDQEQAERAYTQIKSKLGSNIDVNIVKGNQPVYHFMVSVE